MQAVRDAAKEKDLQKLDSLIHHLRSSWEVLRADQPLNVLYGLLRGDALPDGEALSHAVTAVLDKGVGNNTVGERGRNLIIAVALPVTAYCRHIRNTRCCLPPQLFLSYSSSYFLLSSSANRIISTPLSSTAVTAWLNASPSGRASPRSNP